MINLLLVDACEKSFLNRTLIKKILQEVQPDHVYIIISFKEELEYYQDLGVCYTRENIIQGIYTDEQMELDECIPLEDDIFEYMNPYVIEILNQQRRFEQRCDYFVSNTWENHYNTFMHNLFFWNSMLERKQITHTFLTLIPHEGYESIIYHLCKKKNIPIMMTYDALIPEREYILTDYMKSDVAIREEFERLKQQYQNATVEEIELEGNTKEEFEKWSSLDPIKMTPAYMKGDKQKQTFRARYGETNLIRVWRGILGKEYEKYGLDIKFLTASIKKIPELIRVIPSTYKRWSYARPYWKETKTVSDYYEQHSTVPQEGEKYIYFALHYQPESTSNPLGGGAYCDQRIPLQILSRSVPKDIHIYVKAHPDQLPFFGGIEYYQEMLRMPQVRLMKMKCSTFDLIKNAFAVATLTGTAAWECQFYGVPAILFGYSYKNASPLSYHVRTVKECRAVIDDIKSNRKTATLKDLKLYAKASHNLSYHDDDRDKVLLELFRNLEQWK